MQIDPLSVVTQWRLFFHSQRQRRRRRRTTRRRARVRGDGMDASVLFSVVVPCEGRSGCVFGRWMGKMMTTQLLKRHQHHHHHHRR